MLLTNPHRWPGLRIVEGPDLAGLGVGDVLALEINNPVHLGDADMPVRAALPGLRRHASNESDDDVPWLAATDEGWAGSIPGLQAGALVGAGKWKLVLVDDVGVLPSLRQLRGVVVARPLGFNAGDFLQWLCVSDPRFFVHEALLGGGVTRYRRVSGIALDDLRRSRLLGGVVDPERAKTIALASEGRPPSIDLDYDGGVLVGEVVRNGWSALEHFARLIGQPLTWERERSAMQQRFDETDAASVDDLAAFARSLDPVGWQREQLLREECALALAAAR